MSNKDSTKNEISIIKILNLTASDNDKINYLVNEAQKRFSSSILTQFLNELTNKEKIKNASPGELLTCVIKLLKLTKDYAGDKRIEKVREKFLGLMDNNNGASQVDLETLRTDTDG